MVILGKPPIDPCSIAKEIISAVRRQGKYDRPAWNAAAKRALRRKADRKRYLVYPSPGKKGWGEWLCDTVWFTRKEGTIHLAAEVELGGSGDVMFDFQKLLCVKAPLKVMVYRGRKRGTLLEKRANAESFPDYMEAFDHHMGGEHYLFVQFGPGRTDHAYLYKVAKDGSAANVSLQSLI